jgi:hypothetical protein
MSGMVEAQGKTVGPMPEAVWRARATEHLGARHADGLELVNDLAGLLDTLEHQIGSRLHLRRGLRGTQLLPGFDGLAPHASSPLQLVTSMKPREDHEMLQ